VSNASSSIILPAKVNQNAKLNLLFCMPRTGEEEERREGKASNQGGPSRTIFWRT